MRVRVTGSRTTGAGRGGGGWVGGCMPTPSEVFLSFSLGWIEYQQPTFTAAVRFYTLAY